MWQQYFGVESNVDRCFMLVVLVHSAIDCNVKSYVTLNSFEETLYRIYFLWLAFSAKECCSEHSLMSTIIFRLENIGN